MYILIKKIKNIYLVLLSKLMYLIIIIRFKKRISISKLTSIGKYFALQFDISDSYVKIGNQVQFRNNCRIISGLNGKLFISDRVFFNNGCSINCFGKITIGNNCQFGEDVKLYDHNHKYSDNSKLINEQGYNVGEIKIGNNCWIGSNVIILKNVEIGDNVVIGAGCIIHKSVKSNSVVHIAQELKVKNRKGD